MAKINEKKKETISFYKQLLDPMGYTIIPKAAPKVKDTSWKPMDKTKYLEMDSLKIEKTIQDLNSTKVAMQKDLVELKQKVVEYMNRQEPNELTKQLYTGTYARNAITQTGVRLESKAFIEVQNLLNYLTALKVVKLGEELTEGLQKQIQTISSAEISKEIGEIALVVKIE